MQLHGTLLFDRSFDLPHPLAGHTVSEDDFNQHYVSPVLAHSGINVVMFIQDKVCLCSGCHSSSMFMCPCLLLNTA